LAAKPVALSFKKVRPVNLQFLETIATTFTATVTIHQLSAQIVESPQNATPVVICEARQGATRSISYR
jgi:hypothetical protein